jgi:hypothetical protein
MACRAFDLIGEVPRWPSAVFSDLTLRAEVPLVKSRRVAALAP